MLKVIEFAFCAYSVTDMERARTFYEEILGLKPASVFGPDDGHKWVEYELGPHTLAITNMSPDWKPSPNGGGVALEVEDFDAAIKWLKEKSVTFYAEPFASPICRLALISDPDGNSICIHKRNAG
jgi:predicted enzyme related to lactoylglutathione lyase